MLKLYYGRESVDKDCFLFDRIAKTLSDIKKGKDPKQVILLVPDQFTLQAERNAFAYLKVKGLMDLEVLSFNRLGEKVLDETGGKIRVPIDKIGRHMLLSQIVSDENDKLQVFRGMGRSHSFIDMANNLISEMKQYNTDIDSLTEIIDNLEENTLLQRKLNDIHCIFERYEEKIKDKYIDTEDYIDLFISQIGKSSLVHHAEFWVSGFDYLSPKIINILKELIRFSKGVNVVFTADDFCRDRELFQLTSNIIAKLKQTEQNDPVYIHYLSEPPTVVSSELAHLERELFAFPYKEYKDEQDGITFCRAANVYGEVETAAAYITRLVREKGLRYRDIAVICNDMEGRGAIIKRIFEEYGISFFLDQKRKILHNPAVVFLLALLDVIKEGWLFEDVFQLVKTGFCPIGQDDSEDLENYTVRYRIRGKSRWYKEFSYGIRALEEGQLECLNQSRENLVNFISEFEKKFIKAETVRDKTGVLCDFLKDQVELPDKIEELSHRLNEEQEFEAALEMDQIWEGIVNILDQLTELIGDEVISTADYTSMLQAGFESVELGLIPSTMDQVVVGTMQRTRVGKIKALVVIGANDGILPAEPTGDDLLSQDERALLINRNVEICKDDDLRTMEERLAIYKNLSKPEKYLWVGFSASDPEGKELRPSVIFNKLRMLFPQVPLEKDIRNQEDPMVLIERPKSTLNHMTEALQRAGSGEEELLSPWKAAYNWYFRKKDHRLTMLVRGMNFTNRIEKLEANLVKKLFQKTEGKDLTLSPSRLEKFGRCPFAHFVLYGLAPEERRIFEVAGREVGDVYHQCLMGLSENLTVEGMDITDEKSPWMNLTKEQCFEQVETLIDQIASEYKEGMLLHGQEERYRTGRMKDVCSKAAWVMVDHVQQGRIKKIYFEEGFGTGTGKKFPPIQVTVGDRVLSIEGKIDRVDVLPGGYVKVIDYKSGHERFDIEEAKAGWRLQLMLYLKAAIHGLEENGKEVKPAGVFYFEIADPLIDATALDKVTLQTKLETEIRKAFKLDGILLDDQKAIEGMAGDFSGYSEILPIHRNKAGEVKGTTESKLLSEE
ncbi:MAG: exodeoxyribonuclease V subunit gamma, partial [Eubacteriales bacterium]|nr:exodeoxyribonuclease V subunit gamma [Eubacteriales bacterium]